MKRYLLPALLLTTAAAWGQVKDPTIWRFSGNPYRHRVAVADSGVHAFPKANTIAIRSKLVAKAAYEKALETLRASGYVLAFSNPDSLLFGTRAKMLPGLAAQTAGCAIWGRVRPNGTVLFYPFFFNEDARFPTWAGDGRATGFGDTPAYRSFYEAEQAARTFTGGQLVYYRMKP